MLATLTLMSALSMAPNQAGGELELINARVTYGRLGPTRKETKFLPGDVYFVTFETESLQFNKAGEANYSVKMRLLDPEGKEKFKSLEQPYDLFSIQGKGRVSLDAYASIPTDATPGQYSLELTVTDLTSKKVGKLTRKYEVADKTFGIVRLTCDYDAGGPNGPRFPAPGLACVGQVLHLNFAVANFDRDPKSKQPKLELGVRMLDEKGMPTLEKPRLEVLPKPDDQIPEKLSMIPLNFPVALTRSGKFTLELTAADVVTKKTSTVTYPLVVVDPPK
jgi:hypothetical protein